MAQTKVSALQLHNPIKFRASRNAAANTGNGAFATLAFDVEQYDTGGNLSSGVFTAPVSGFYQFNWNSTVTLSTGADEIFLATLHVNGTRTADGSQPNYRNNQSSHGSDLIQLTAGDTVDVKVYAPVTRALVVGTIYHNYFSGHLVSVT